MFEEGQRERDGAEGERQGREGGEEQPPRIRRMIEQGGLTIDNVKVESDQHDIPVSKLTSADGIMVKKGKRVRSSAVGHTAPE